MDQAVIGQGGIRGSSLVFSQSMRLVVLPTRALSACHATSHTSLHLHASCGHAASHATAGHGAAAHGGAVLAHAHATTAAGWHGHAHTAAHTSAHASCTAHAHASSSSRRRNSAGPLHCRNYFALYAGALFSSGNHAVYNLAESDSVVTFGEKWSEFVRFWIWCSGGWICTVAMATQ